LVILILVDIPQQSYTMHPGNTHITLNTKR